MIFSGVCHGPFQKYVEECVCGSRHPCRTPTVVQNQSPRLLLKKDGTSGLVIEVFDDSDKVGADVVLLHRCPQSCMSNPVDGLLEVYEDMVNVLLVVEIFLTEDS